MLAEHDEAVESATTLEHPNCHMALTIEMIRAPSGLGRDADPLPFYAMTNAAKCAAKDGSRVMVPAELFEHCKEFARGEIRILDPQVIVTQGAQARAVLADAEELRPERLEPALAPLTKIEAPVASWLRSWPMSILGVGAMATWTHWCSKGLIPQRRLPLTRRNRFHGLDGTP